MTHVDSKQHKLLIAFGEQVRKQRLDRNLSQEALAARTGLHRNSIGRIERAEFNITLTTLGRIAKALKMSISDLMRF